MGTRKSITLFVLAIGVHALGLFLFTKGFLLTRTVLPQKSTCKANFTMTGNPNHLHGGCWTQSNFKRAVILIIDALRYDFAKYDPRYGPNEYTFINKLPVIDELLRQKPYSSRLYKFVADPPTTTMQRLKGLTTGSLPTFVDMGANFASAEITEDNVIDQLRAIGKRITFMGDDTWTSLFPNRFHRCYPFPSLNVQDLHTVDNGVLRHLLPEIRAADWDVVIGHFLGVDHCGHRYGPYHPEMAKKLTQMNNVISSVVKSLDRDTVLFVMGDHGMTRTGDHGGDSTEELEAAMFVYTPATLSNEPYNPEAENQIAQVDFVPTLSLLLGSPVPFPNLGTVLPELLSHCPWHKGGMTQVEEAYHELNAVRANAHQVRSYLHTYMSVSKDINRYTFDDLEYIFQESEKYIQGIATDIYAKSVSTSKVEDADVHQKLSWARNYFLDYLKRSKEMCQKVWAKFDMIYIIMGLMTLFVALCFDIAMLRLQHDSQALLLTLLFVGAYVILLTAICTFHLSFPGFVVSMTSTVMLLVIIYKALTSHYVGSWGVWAALTEWFSPDGFAFTVYLATCAGYFSNSFVVYEDRITTSVSIVLICVTIHSIMRGIIHRQRKKDDTLPTDPPRIPKYVKGDFMKAEWTYWTSSYGMPLGILTVCCICIRLSSWFNACREEQQPCDSASFLTPIGSLTPEQSAYRNQRYCLSVASVLILTYLFRTWLRHHGNLNGYSPPVVALRFGPWLVAMAVCGHWAVSAVPDRERRWSVWQVLALPRLAYCGLLLLAGVVLASPLCIHMVQRGSKPYTGMTVSVQRLFTHLRTNWQEHFLKQVEDRTPLVYGLGTVYSSALLTVLLALFLLAFLLLGDGLAPQVLLMFIVLFIVLELHSTNVSLEARGKPVPSTAWLPLVTFVTCASMFFFHTGHQHTVTTIRWEAAYVGFHGDFHKYIIPVLLIGYNTFVSHIIWIFSLPLLLCWPLFRGHVIFYLDRYIRVDSTSRSKGEFVMHEDTVGLRDALWRLSFQTLFLYGLKLFACACAAAHLRRHLMVWKIFAPRFVFEAATFLVIAIVLPLSILFFLRVDRALRSWTSKLQRAS